jgi:hypothetical protein
MALYLMGFAGFLLHFLSRYGEFGRTAGHFPPVLEYLAKDPPGWIAAALGAVVCVAARKELVGFLSFGGVDITALADSTAWVFVAAYFGSSQVAKLPAIITTKGGIR